MSFVPAQHRPVNQTPEERLQPKPHDVVCSDYSFYNVAWSVYNKMLKKEVKKSGISLYQAHLKLQADHPVTFPENLEIWANQRLGYFLQQFEKWQHRSYDLTKIHEASRKVPRLPWGKTMPFETYFTLTLAGDGDELCRNLALCDQRYDDLKLLLNDPIYGREAEFEIRTHEQSVAYAASEAWRRSLLHENVKRIDELLMPLGPTNYNVVYPHKTCRDQIPNCLCVMGDGCGTFKLEVLDPETVTYFRLVKLYKPWWSLGVPGKPLTTDPETAEYDFPFHDFGIHEGDVFDLDQLMAVINRGCSQMATREERKWGNA